MRRKGGGGDLEGRVGLPVGTSGSACLWAVSGCGEMCMGRGGRGEYLRGEGWVPSCE